MDDFWKGALGVLSTVAPTLATAVGGPLAGVAVNALIGALGLAPGSDAKAVAAAIAAATPDQLLAIKKTEADFMVQMKALNVSIDQLAASDTKDARQMDLSMVQAKSWLAYGPLAVSILIFALFGWDLSGFGAINEDAEGVIRAAFGLAVGYWLGSTHANTQKDQLLYQSTPRGN